MDKYLITEIRTVQELVRSDQESLKLVSSDIKHRIDSIDPIDGASIWATNTIADLGKAKYKIIAVDRMDEESSRLILAQQIKNNRTVTTKVFKLHKL